MPKPSKLLPLTIFYGVPVETIAEVCAVSLGTAYQYKSGTRRPGTSATKLMQLHNAGRILGKEFMDFRVRGSTIVDPEGNITTAGQLRAYGLIMQLVAEWTRTDAARRSQVEPIYETMATAARRA